MKCCPPDWGDPPWGNPYAQRTWLLSPVSPRSRARSVAQPEGSVQQDEPLLPLFPQTACVGDVPTRLSSPADQQGPTLKFKHLHSHSLNSRRAGNARLCWERGTEGLDRPPLCFALLGPGIGAARAIRNLRGGSGLGLTGAWEPTRGQPGSGRCEAAVGARPGAPQRLVSSALIN